MQILYKATVTATGGREGRVQSSDNVIELNLAIPKELGGPGGRATNPEQLFAGGYAACFEGAVRFAARSKKIPVKEAHVTAEVGIGKDDPGFKLAVTLTVDLPGMDRTLAEGILQDAHRICPYSKATRGNIEVQTILK